MKRITLLEAAHRFGYKTARSFEKNHIKDGERFPFHTLDLPNGRKRKVIDEEIIEKAMQNNQYQYQIIGG